MMKMKSGAGMLSVLMASLLMIGCGGSKKDKPAPAADAGIIEDAGMIEDSGITEEDSGIVEDDAGITENDAGVIGDDAGVLEDDAGIIEDDAGMDDPDAGPAEDDGFINIPAGSFVLSHGTGTYSEGDTVTLPAFKLDKTPVTVAEFEKCVADGACTSQNYDKFDAEDYSNKYCNYNRGNEWKNHPMNCVTRAGAEEYCAWIGGRLPTEEEWEYAATHNGTAHLNTTYAFGDTLEHCVNANYWDDVSETYCRGTTEDDSEGVGTSAVGTYSPAGDSPLGLVDMTGNVSEWTASVYNSTSYTTKGGAWYDSEDSLPVDIRDHYNIVLGSMAIGFRCAK